MGSHAAIESIARALAAELERRGVAGTLSVSSDRAFLRLGRGQRQVALGTLCAQWLELTEGERDHSIRALGDGLTSNSGVWSRRLSGSAIGATLVVLASMAWQARHSRVDAAGPSPPPPLIDERLARQHRVCEAAVSRAMRGATLGPADAEGWVVEVTLVRAAGTPLSADASVTPFFTFAEPLRGHLHWPSLQAQSGTAPDVHLREAAMAVPSSPRVVTTLTFDNPHAASYFDAATRIEWVRLAHQLAKSVQAERAALYARCEHQSSHHVGAWFYGQTAGDMAGIMIWSMLGSSRVPLLKPQLLPHSFEHPDSIGLVFNAINERASARNLHKRELSLLLAADGGSLEGKDEGPLGVLFPVRDSNRAARSAMRLGRSLDVVSER